MHARVIVLAGPSGAGRRLALQQTARRWAAEAVEALGPLPKSAVKRGLERMADSIVTREG